MTDLLGDDDDTPLNVDPSFAELLESDLYTGTTAELLNPNGDATDDGYSFRKIPELDDDADRPATDFFDASFVQAALAAHDTHCAMPRRLFEDIERAAASECKMQRVASRRVAPSSFIGASLGGGWGTQAVPQVTADTRRPSDAASVDSMEAWRRTVVLGPPTPPAVSPVTVTSMTTSRSLPVLPPALAQRSDKVARDVVFSSRLFAPLLAAEIEGLLARSVVYTVTLVRGTCIAREGVQSRVSHVLILVSGQIALMRAGCTLTLLDRQGDVMLAEWCSSPSCRRASIVTMEVVSDVCQCWAVPCELVQRLMVAMRVARQRGVN